MTKQISRFRAIVAKELICLNSGSELFGTIFFSLTAVVVSSFAFRFVGIERGLQLRLAIGVLWLVFIFSGVVGTRLLYRSEVESGGLVSMQLSGFRSIEIFFGKVTALTALLFVVQSSAVLLTELFFQITFAGVRLEILLINLLAALAFAAVATVFGVLSLTEGFGERILSVAMLPFVIPLLYCVVLLTVGVVSGGAINLADFWFHLLLALVVIYTAAGAILCDYFLVG